MRNPLALLCRPMEFIFANHNAQHVQQYNGSGRKIVFPPLAYNDYVLQCGGKVSRRHKRIGGIYHDG